MNKPIHNELLLGPLKSTPLDTQLPGMLGQSHIRLLIRQPLHVQQQDLRVTAQTRMTHDIVRGLRVTPNRRDSMPKHPGGLFSTSWVKALGSVL
ncbi:hypothetical protein ACFYRI_06375 [Streptomyces microflavus]|uniref:hypothetical protein n=1 Tax=Streptomyces microflavus TaxID=1919 RepID=UPI003675E79C